MYKKNRRTSERVITHRGESKTLKQWAKGLGIAHATLSQRIDVLDWPLDRALTVRAQASQKSKNKMLLDPIGMRCSKCKTGIYIANGVTYKVRWNDERETYWIKFTCGYCNNKMT